MEYFDTYNYRQNLQTLSDCNREISLTLAEDGVNADQFGVISNPLVKVRNLAFVMN